MSRGSSIAAELSNTDGQRLREIGTAEALLLVIRGHPVGREKLTGPGAPTLYERLT